MKTQLLQRLRGRVTRWGARRSAGILETVSYQGAQYVLLPHRCNWQDDPQWERQWESEVANGVIGNEQRRGMRAQPRVRLAWTISTRDLQETALLNERIRAGRKSGRACAPYWGRASHLASQLTVGSLAVTLEATAWTWAAGDYIFFLDPITGEFDVGVLETVAGVNLTLRQPLSRTYAAGLQVWPLVFGKLIAEEMPAVTSHHGSVRCAIQELVSPATAPVGAFAFSGTGIGVFRIGSTFVVAGDYFRRGSILKARQDVPRVLFDRRTGRFLRNAK